MKPNIWIFPIEPIETRYTAQWYDHIPRLLNDTVSDLYNIRTIDGVQKNSQVTEGAFLNFSDTNYWKSSQLCKFLEKLNTNQVTTNDHIVITDAWNPIVIQLKYMKELLGYKWKLHGFWHAGSYDKNDFLGRLIGNKPWVRNAERSMFDSFDHNYFATEYHIRMFEKVLFGYDTSSGIYQNNKVIRTGWPMEYMESLLSGYDTTNKTNTIIFPHRIAPEKQLSIFLDLKEQLPEYEFIVCQDHTLTKYEYHKLLARSKIVFSANLQETLGISSCIEGPLLDALPLVPNRLSYTEIFDNHQEFMYNTDYTINTLGYQTNKKHLVEKIKDMIQNYDSYLQPLNSFKKHSFDTYFTAQNFIHTLRQLP